MKQFVLLLKSFRLLNVFSMLFLLVGLKAYVFNHFVYNGNYIFSKSIFEFILFLIIIALISASGYLVNDIIDVKVDKVNKPLKELAYSQQILWIVYSVMNIIAVVISALILDTRLSFLIILATVILLLLYSLVFQKLPVLGNLVIAILGSVLPILYSDFDDLQKVRGSVSVGLAIRVMIYSYSLIGFFLMLFREIIKDIEDIKGDRAEGYKTLPILLGRKRTNRILLFLMLSFFSLVLVYYLLLEADYFPFLGIIFLYLISVYFLFKRLLTKASLFLKLTLFSGVLILFIL